jgi:hypothetical protein
MSLQVLNLKYSTAKQGLILQNEMRPVGSPSPPPPPRKNEPWGVVLPPRKGSPGDMSSILESAVILLYLSSPVDTGPSSGDQLTSRTAPRYTVVQRQ